MSADCTLRLRAPGLAKTCASQACASLRKKVNRKARAAHWRSEGQRLGIPSSVARFMAEQHTRQLIAQHNAEVKAIQEERSRRYSSGYRFPY